MTCSQACMMTANTTAAANELRQHASTQLINRLVCVTCLPACSSRVTCPSFISATIRVAATFSSMYVSLASRVHVALNTHVQKQTIQEYSTQFNKKTLNRKLQQHLMNECHSNRMLYRCHAQNLTKSQKYKHLLLFFTTNDNTRQAARMRRM